MVATARSPLTYGPWSPLAPAVVAQVDPGAARARDRPLRPLPLRVRPLLERSMELGELEATPSSEPCSITSLIVSAIISSSVPTRPGGSNVDPPVARPRRIPRRFEQFFAIRRFQPALEFMPIGPFSPVRHEHVRLSSTVGDPRSGVGRQQQLTAFQSNTVRSVALRRTGRDRLHGRPARRRVPRDLRGAGQGGLPEQLTEAPQVAAFLQRRVLVAGWRFLASRGTTASRPTWTSAPRHGTGRYVRMLFGGAMYACPSHGRPTGRNCRARTEVEHRYRTCIY